MSELTQERSLIHANIVKNAFPDYQIVSNMKKNTSKTVP